MSGIVNCVVVVCGTGTGTRSKYVSDRVSLGRKGYATRCRRHTRTGRATAGRTKAACNARELQHSWLMTDVFIAELNTFDDRSRSTTYRGCNMSTKGEAQIVKGEVSVEPPLQTNSFADLPTMVNGTLSAVRIDGRTHCSAPDLTVGHE